MHDNTHLELVVGIFLLSGIICVSLLALRMGELTLFPTETYTLKARFDNVSGLTEGAFVEIAGVRVGKVGQIDYDTENYLALISMRLNNKIRISEDSIASIRTSGIIGERFVHITPGGSDTLLSDGMEIAETESSINLEALISKYIFESGDQ